MSKAKPKWLGKYIIADPAICHGKPTFVGTRILVALVLKQMGKGMSWEGIVEEWGGAVSRDAIAEAAQLASRTFEDHAIEYANESLPA